MSCLVDLFLYIILPLGVLGYWWLNKRFTHWKDRGLPGPEPLWKNLAGNTKDVGSKVNLVTRLNELYNQFRGKAPAIGIYMSVNPAVLVIDPEMAKTILVKDFSKFHDHGFYFNEKDDPLSAHLFNLEGAKWKTIRNKLSPTFTSGKLKMMYSTIERVGDDLIAAIDEFAKKDEAFDVKILSSRFTGDVVGSTAFGIDTGCLKGNDELIDLNTRLTQAFSFASFSLIFKMLFKDLSRKLGLRLMPKDVSDYFMNLLSETIGYREKNNVKRNDFLQLLIQLKNHGILDGETGEAGEKFTFNEIAAQAFVFFFAGFETSSAIMNYTMFHLATNPEIQQKAREEILEKIAKHDGKLTYEALMEMEYLNQVFNETMRIYPAVPFLMRVANEDYIIPGTKTKVDKGTQVMVYSYGFQMDPEYFPDPKKFDPERFTKENSESRHPFSFLPFGEGPRICIGNRFAQLQSRFGLALMLKNFNWTLSEKTKVPLEFVNDLPGFFVKGGIWVKASRL